ncbi:MAG: phosphate ABC transporter substrate-binding protein, PhoT family [Chitinophagaceae bacterium]|nr:MAG: phosphate ABC transporter substrate-binding protein, PhoT family [Chitinophagaceae bacterium]
MNRRMSSNIGKTFGWALILGAWALAGCGGSAGPDEPGDTLDSGTIHISVDESFRPVIDSEIRVFEALHRGAHIVAHYKPEAECLKDFLVDSIRMVIATRGFTEPERLYINDSMNVDVRKKVLAYDAIAVIVHPGAPDSLFTMQELKDLLTGKSAKKLRPVFDGLKATSTVRFVIDSVLRGPGLSPNVTAAESSEGVIDYVSRTKDAVGFIGVSWVGNRQDTTQLSYLDKVRVASIEHPMLPRKYVTPAQFNIFYRRYPLVRDLVATLKERHRGLGRGFYNFLGDERGQLIFNRSYLMPATQDFTIRGAELRE